jgi:pimeloyl-ACP methyl ester carboxylesterase/glycine cleavage system regulatory protein
MEAHVITDIPAVARARWHVDDLVSKTVLIDGRPASYAVGGRGLPVLFLHGWSLDHRAYQRSLRRLTFRGCRVLSPSLPGFGGTAELPRHQRTLAGYAEWVAKFVEAVGGDEPMLVLGHSFGGGVATKFAHLHSDQVRYLVLLNSVGDPRSFIANAVNKMSDLRGRALLAPIIEALRPTAEGIGTTALIQRVAIENTIRNPLAVLRAGLIAASADLTREMAVLAERNLPVLVLWSDHDGVIPLSAFDTFCSTFGTDGHVVRGGHSWLLANPDVFGEVLDNVIHLQSAQHGTRAATANTSQLRELLARTTVPRRVASRLLANVSPLWVLSESPAVLAADLALCHPKLAPNEVRAVARPLPTTNSYRLTVVAADRPGLLADTAATLAAEGVSIVAASVMTWPSEGLALHAVTVQSTTEFDSVRWATIGQRLREMASGTRPVFDFVPSGRARVTHTGEGDGKAIVRVTAPDQLGLLAAACRWFAEHGGSIEAADITTVDGEAKDVFLVDGDVNTASLARHLSARLGPTPCSMVRSLWRTVRG